MAFDRQSIEKRDFPIARRGYEPEAVHAHLRVVAEELQTIRESSGRRTEGLATAAAEQVRSIVEAAENSAGEIERGAEDEARRMRQQAEQEAERTRSSAGTEAREHVAKVEDMTAALIERITTMDSELNSLVEGLRSGANRLSSDLKLLQSSVSEALPGPGGARPTQHVEHEEEAVGVEEPREEGEEEPEEELEPERAPRLPGEGDEGARLVALNMALNGTPREETDRYLAENFDIEDRDRLLDEVYARVSG